MCNVEPPRGIEFGAYKLYDIIDRKSDEQMSNTRKATLLDIVTVIN